MKIKYLALMLMASTSIAAATCPKLTAETAKSIKMNCEQVADVKARTTKTLREATKASQYCITTFSVQSLSQLLKTRGLTLEGTPEGNNCFYTRDDETTFIHLIVPMRRPRL
jgi:hypothetical protein